MVENETGLKIKKLCSDNEENMKTPHSKRFCYENEIKIERTVPGTPQKNSLSEIMNRTLTERSRSKRLHAGFPR